MDNIELNDINTKTYKIYNGINKKEPEIVGSLIIENYVIDGGRNKIFTGIYNNNIRVCVRINNPQKLMHICKFEKDFKQEIEIYESLPENSYIVKYYGWTKIKGRLVCILELADCDLFEYIKTNKLEHIDKYNISLNVIKGINFLHTYNFTYCDTKLENILIFKKEDGNIIIKLCDLDPFTFTEMYAPLETNLKDSKKVNKKSDIWTYGMFIWGLWTDASPYDDGYSITHMLKNKMLPSLTDKALPYTVRIICEKCFNFNNELRPDANEIINMLTDEIFLI